MKIVILIDFLHIKLMYTLFYIFKKKLLEFLALLLNEYDIVNGL